ncbi:hypothetical protein M3765_11775 [Streptomyces thermoviolaceus]|uniref:hypothetical protein n=1 Tax=Streptomyces thermoviolaceus TaxID=1952 RepID=UPI0020408C2A|nr:hypothetical protein [Streptomyces thermoviolaceus]MCM3264699.1 hypothetical protein [Streptomyces thermoviolaceus]
MTAFVVFVHRIRDLWSERPVVDWLAAATLVVGHLLYCHLTKSDPLFAPISGDRRKDIYTTTASASALIGGFGTAAISQYATANGRRMLEIRRRFGASLRRNWSSVLSAMLIVTAACLLALIVDIHKKPGGIGWAIEFVLIFGSLRSIRLLWLFGMLIDVADQDVTEPRRSPAVAIPRSNAGNQNRPGAS